MLNRLFKILGPYLLICLTFSFPIFKSQGQQRNHSKASEITFLGKEETKWIEKREIPLPVIIGQGVKEEPRVDSFDLREDSIGPMKKMSPSTIQPGCAYSSRFTIGIAKAFVGVKALYERGRYQYFEGNYEEAISCFQKLIEEYPVHALTGSAIYWMGEANYRQGRDEEAFLQFSKVVEKHPGSEFYAYALYSD
jgi:TolA-binding protein